MATTLEHKLDALAREIKDMKKELILDKAQGLPSPDPEPIPGKL